MSTEALAYLRTSSAANVLGDSAPRQREAINLYAKRTGIKIVGEFYDSAVSGADPIDQRPGFGAMLARIAGNGVRMILVENASRFARDVMVQETGHALLLKLGITMVAVDDPDAFTGDTPTAKMVRVILGAVAEFEKANLVAKLQGARNRASEKAGRRVEGRKGYRDTKPELIREAKRLARKSPLTGEARSLRDISKELATLGHVTASGNPFAAAQVRRLLAAKVSA